MAKTAHSQRHEQLLVMRERERERENVSNDASI